MWVSLLLLGGFFSFDSEASPYFPLEKAGVFVDAETDSIPLATAIRVLREETERRTGVPFPVLSRIDERDAVVVIRLQQETASTPKLPPEAFNIVIEGSRLILTGADSRGVLYGIGHILRMANWGPGKMHFPVRAATTQAPAYPLRGHQLGYRAKANSYDAWDDAQYEQYIRELALFGVNAIENIPFQDERDSPHMPLDRRAMNRRISEICRDYGLEYWIWTPAEFDLSDAEKRAAHLKEHEQLYRECPELTAVFFPGGDPGANPPELVLPFLEELAVLLRRHHPHATIWLSLQWFNEKQAEEIITWLKTHSPAWFGGIVFGPGSPPLLETWKRIAGHYPIRHYPDITHTVRCQYPVHWWDPAFGVTLGREPINPQPMYYAFIHDFFAPYTIGFISYSDGMNDDVNKIVWTRRAWQPGCDARDILIEYARFFFGPEHASEIADGILALEKNWEGPLLTNGGVPATLALWRDLETRAPELLDDWRWQSLLVRAYYDAYIRLRVIHEPALEREANALLAQADTLGPEAAMQQATVVLDRTEREPIAPDLHKRILELFDLLFHSIGLQSSVPLYQASGYERGCSLDFLNYPLNNRWWLTDEFARIRAMTSEDEQKKALARIVEWENPGAGSFYDQVGHVGRSARVIRTEGLNTDPLMLRSPNPGPWWWEEGFSRARLSWQITLNFPFSMRYEGLDPKGRYTLRVNGYGEARPSVHGNILTPSVYGTGLHEFKEFPVPPEYYASGELTITWEALDESHLNWRQHSRIAEVWLLKHDN